VAGMKGLADAACMRRSSRGCPGQRAERAPERDEQQKFGDPTMHASLMQSKLNKLHVPRATTGTISPHQDICAAISEGDEQVNKHKYQIVMPA